MLALGDRGYPCKEGRKGECTAGVRTRCSFKKQGLSKRKVWMSTANNKNALGPATVLVLVARGIAFYGCSTDTREYESPNTTESVWYGYI